MSKTIDLTKYPAEQYLTPGVYMVTITGLKQVMNENSGNRGVEVQLKDGAGNTGKMTLWLTEKAMWKVHRLAIAAGLDEDQRRRFEWKFLNGKKLTIRVDPEYDDSTGKTYSRIDEFWPAEAYEQIRSQFHQPPVASAAASRGNGASGHAGPLNPPGGPADDDFAGDFGNPDDEMPF